MSAIRPYKLEIVKPSQDQRDRWMACARDMQHMTNCIWRIWLTHHTAAGTEKELRACLNAPKEEKRQWPKAVTNELSNKIYHALRDRWPAMHTRPLVLLLNVVLKKIVAQKASRGKLPGWAAVLLDHQAIPSSTRPLPIPFDKCHSKLIPPEQQGGNFKLRFKLERDASGEMVEDEVELITSGRAWYYAKPMYDLVTGGKVFKGSSLVFDDRKGKWFAHVCYERVLTDKPAIDPDKVAVLACGRKLPWRIRVDGKTLRSFWRGDAVPHIRRQLRNERVSRSDHYRYVGHNAKGHGRNRWEKKKRVLSRRWVNFVKRANNQQGREITRLVANRGVGTLIYIQPTRPRFLSHSGTEMGAPAGWEFYQLGERLKNNCNELGIKVIVRKQRERQGGARGEIREKPHVLKGKKGGARKPSRNGKPRKALSGEPSQ